MSYKTISKTLGEKGTTVGAIIQKYKITIGLELHARSASWGKDEDEEGEGSSQNYI